MGGKIQTTFPKKYLIGLVATILVLISFGVGMVVGERKPALETNGSNKVSAEVKGIGQSPDYLSKDSNIKLLWDAWKIVKDNYVDQPVNDTQILYGAIAGVVASLKDPHSIFFTPDTNQSFLQELSGSFFGIGAELAVKNDQLQIVAPISGSPAETAGLRGGDYIVKINGEDATKMSLDEAVSKIRGPKGTEVTLTIFRNGDRKTRDFKIVRDEIKIVSVTYKTLPNNIGYIKLSYFNEDTASAFDKAVKQVLAAKPAYLILDMRNNPGGFLDTAVRIASDFIPDGVIVSEKSSTGEITSTKSNGSGRLKNYKVIVLLNEGSASASEILAGALRDYGIAQIVGKKSYGKGSVQTLFNMDDGSSIKLTIAKWLTPKGNAIDGVGLLPDVEVDLTDEDFNKDLDPQLDKALEIIKAALSK